MLRNDRTWRGERGEEWSSAQGLESILISIQSLLSSNPYENEPGFEEARSTYDKKNQAAYVAKVSFVGGRQRSSLASSNVKLVDTT